MIARTVRLVTMMHECGAEKTLAMNFDKYTYCRYTNLCIWKEKSNKSMQRKPSLIDSPMPRTEE